MKKTCHVRVYLFIFPLFDCWVDNVQGIGYGICSNLSIYLFVFCVCFVLLWIYMHCFIKFLLTKFYCRFARHDDPDFVVEKIKNNINAVNYNAVNLYNCFSFPISSFCYSLTSLACITKKPIYTWYFYLICYLLIFRC